METTAQSDSTRTGISVYYSGLQRGRKPACAHTGGKAPKACLASHEWTIKDALLTGLVVVERILAASLTEQQRFLQILEVLEREFDLVRGTLMLVGADGGTLHVQALLADEDGQPTVRETYRRGEGITGRVLETGLASVIPDIAGDPDFVDRIHRRRDRGPLTGVAFLCVPIRLDREVIGTLAADRNRASPLGLDDAERVLSVVAGLIAHHVQIAREAAAHQASLAARTPDFSFPRSW